MVQIYRSEQGQAAILKQYAMFLSFWPFPRAQHVVPTGFGDTFVIESGNPNGQPLVLLHGTASNSAMWMGDAAVLGQTHRLFAVDIIGEPGNSAQARPQMDGGNYARWLREVLDGLDISKAAIAGNSLGGWIALDFAALAPERVSALVLLAASGLYPFRRSFALRMLASRIFPKSSSLSKTVTGGTEMPEAVLEFLALIRREFIPRTLHAPVFGGKLLKRLVMPVLYIGGADDTLLNTQRSAARLKRFAPHAHTRVLPGVGHTVINQAEEIDAFLSTQEV